MSTLWRKLAPVAVAGGLIAASGAIPALAASPAAYSITISAKVKFPKVTGDSLVFYQYKGLDTAAIHGQIKGASPGDVATLLSEPFGAKHFRPTGATIKLAGHAPLYSFTVQPGVAIKYEVQVSTGKTVDVTSSVQTVYVTLANVLKGQREKCGRTSCAFSWILYTKVPVADYKLESAKHFYLYLAVGYPRIPKNYTLATNARVSKITKINAGEFKMTLTWFIRLRHGTATWITNFCSKDTESRDGIGLPGPHGCGARTVNVKQANLYLG